MNRQRLYRLFIISGAILGTAVPLVFLTLSVRGFRQFQPSVNIIQQKSLELPFKIMGTDLIGERLISYDGPYLEDGNNNETFNHLAVILHNPVDRWIQSVSITILTESGHLEFSGTHIPPMARVALLEQSGKKYRKYGIIACSAVEENQDNSNITGDFSIRELSMGNIEITNLTGKVYKQIVLHHKTYDQKADIYVGGITYNTTIQNIQPYETRELTLGHYVKGYSKIVKITN